MNITKYSQPDVNVSKLKSLSNDYVKLNCHIFFQCKKSTEKVCVSSKCPVTYNKECHTFIRQVSVKTLFKLKNAIYLFFSFFRKWFRFPKKHARSKLSKNAGWNPSWSQGLLSNRNVSMSQGQCARRSRFQYWFLLTRSGSIAMSHRQAQPPAQQQILKSLWQIWKTSLQNSLGVKFNYLTSIFLFKNASNILCLSWAAMVEIELTLSIWEQEKSAHSNRILTWSMSHQISFFVTEWNKFSNFSWFLSFCHKKPLRLSVLLKPVAW